MTHVVARSPRPAWRLAALTGLTVAVIASLSVTEARAPVLTLPRVKATTSVIEHDGKPALLLRSLLVTRIHGSLRVGCNKCLRLVGPSRESSPSRSSKRFSNANWILQRGRAVRVTVVRRGWVGRYLLLTARSRKGHLRLAYKATGCVNQELKVVHCPRGTKPPKPPAVQKTPAPTAPPPPPPPPTTTTPTTPTPTPRGVCADGMDNDGDGKIDYPTDHECYSATDPSERNLACGDGIDNDGDGAIDFPADRNCNNPEDGTEFSPPCSDGKDNDGDGAVDFPADLGCTSPNDTTEKQ